MKTPWRALRSTLVRRAGALLLACAAAAPATAQEPPARRDTGRAGEEGRRISEYDFAVSHAMRALMAAGPERRRVTVYVARKEGDLWHVYFGSFDARRSSFQIAYEVVQKKAGSAAFGVRRYRRDVPADPELNEAATALVTALDAFEPRTVRFRTYVWRDAGGRWVAYFVPSVARRPFRVPPAPPGIDKRVVVSPDARRILETREYPSPDSEATWIDPSRRLGPTLRELLTFFFHPHLAPFSLIGESLVCEMNWRGEIERCLIAPPAGPAPR